MYYCSYAVFLWPGQIFKLIQNVCIVEMVNLSSHFKQFLLPTQCCNTEVNIWSTCICHVIKTMYFICTCFYWKFLHNPTITSTTNGILAVTVVVVAFVLPVTKLNMLLFLKQILESLIKISISCLDLIICRNWEAVKRTTRVASDLPDGL